MNTEKFVHMNIKIPRELRDAVVERAKLEDRPMAAFVRRAMQAALEKPVDK